MESDFNWQADGHPSGSTLMAALDSELSPQQGVAVEHHIAECPECAAQWQRLVHVSGRLGEFHHSISRAYSLPEFELRLPPDKSPGSAIAGWLELLRRPQFLIPAAAMAAMLLALALWTNSKVRQSTPSALPVTAGRAVRRPAVTATETANQALQPAPHSNIDEHRTLQTRRAAVRPPRPTRDTAQSVEAHGSHSAPDAKADSSTPQTAEVFWALPYSDPALREEGAEIVRADLPREAFLKAGVPLANLPPSGPRGQITADVLLGVDGLPRAIRPARMQVSETVISTPL